MRMESTILIDNFTDELSTSISDINNIFVSSNSINQIDTNLENNFRQLGNTFNFKAYDTASDTDGNVVAFLVSSSEQQLYTGWPVPSTDLLTIKAFRRRNVRYEQLGSDIQIPSTDNYLRNNANLEFVGDLQKIQSSDLIKISEEGTFLIVRTLHSTDQSQAGKFGSISVYQYDEEIRDWVRSKDVIKLNDAEDYAGFNFGQSFDMSSSANVIIAGSNNTVDGRQGICRVYAKDGFTIPTVFNVPGIFLNIYLLPQRQLRLYQLLPQLLVPLLLQPQL